MDIKFNINGNNIVKIDLYEYGSELFDELKRLQIIDRMKSINQLGPIKIEKAKRKSRYDYILLQLYYHQIIRETINKELKFSYNNLVKECCFNIEYEQFSNYKIPSIMDLIQLFILIYNAGHFYNTFTSSIAAIHAIYNNNLFKSLILEECNDNNFCFIFNNIIKSHDYFKFHLLNSIMILNRCDPKKFSVLLSKLFIYLYINKDELSKYKKINYVFYLFSIIRNISYISYDLPISNIPFSIDITNKKNLITLFKELISEYNDKTLMHQLLISINKLLNDLVYNNTTKSICYYQISNKIVRSIDCIYDIKTNYYNNFFIDQNSIFNKTYPRRISYDTHEILKLTFNDIEKDIARKLFTFFNNLKCTCVGYYDRHDGKKTILLSIKKRCSNSAIVAFKVMKATVSSLMKLPKHDPDDIRFLLVLKFFLYYLFNRKPVRIYTTINDKKCVFCVRGKKKRIKIIDTMLNNSCGTYDQTHEVEHLKNCLIDDPNNFTTLFVPGSIIVYDNNYHEQICEFDGLAVFPTKQNDQILFLEAKNVNKRSKAVKSLCEKFKKLQINCNKQISLKGHDAFVYIDILSLKK